jgi:DNA primase
MDDKELSFNQFVRNFKENTSAKDYYKSRGLSRKLVDENLIGFCPSYSRYSFPLLKGRLIVPVKDPYGKIIALAGRQIPELEEATTQALWESWVDEPAKSQDRINKWKKGKWINEPYQKSRNLFFLDIAKEEILIKNYVILMEGYFDVLSFHDKGLSNVCAICGTSISEYQIVLASRFCDNIVVLMDSDFAGRTASKKISSKIEELGLNPIRVYLPTGMDPDDFARNYDVSFLDESIKKLIEQGKQEIYIQV